MKNLLLYLGLLISTISFAQSYSIGWFTIDGGGTSTGGVYAMGGTIGQPDAGPAMTGGNFSLTGGFWSLFAVQTTGAPTLYISGFGSNVTVYWQDVPGWNLVQSGNLATPVGSWPASSSPTLTDGTNYLTLVNPAGNLFFRLKNP
ncbi:MAG TPA: hypothetical protein VNN22_05195 [Verrucomicrobiae bacterium]|nr:hypothetical protein [Verrucomicrobiae bacterium]